MVNPHNAKLRENALKAIAVRKQKLLDARKHGRIDRPEYETRAALSNHSQGSPNTEETSATISESREESFCF
jgi:hypothetical protein